MRVASPVVTSKRFLVLIIVGMTEAIPGGSAAAEGSSATLGFEGPGLLQADRSGVARGRFYCILGTRELVVSGWSFGIEGLGITRVTANTSGTVLDHISGAEVTVEEAAGTAGRGVVCRVSLPAPLTLRTGRVLALDVEMEPELTNATAVLRMARLDGPSGTVRNVVREEDGSEVPILLHDIKRIAGRPPEPCGEAMLGFSSMDVESEDLLVDVLGSHGGTTKLVVPAEQGARSRARIHVALVTLIDWEHFAPVCGWGLSVRVDGDAVPVGASFRNTAAGKYYSGGYERTGVPELDPNDGRQGVLSTVLLTFGGICGIPNVGTITILEVEIEETHPHGLVDTRAVIWFDDGLRFRPDSSPIDNHISIRGEGVVPCNKDDAFLEVVFSLEGPRFLRGDSNRDGRIAISDPVFLLSGLFQEQRVDNCPAASDANADSRVDMSDAIYLLAHLFLGGPSPPAPFPDCGPDPAGREASLPCLEPPPGCR